MFASLCGSVTPEHYEKRDAFVRSYSTVSHILGHERQEMTSRYTHSTIERKKLLSTFSGGGQLPANDSSLAIGCCRLQSS
jgi:hypothetical protein